MKINRILLYIFCVALFTITTTTAFAQQCDNSKPVARDSSRFDVNDNGTVTDIESGLTWQRCAVGQHWQGGTCVGKARPLTWNQARVLIKSKQQSRNGQYTWRIPKLTEIAGIADIRCRSPRIDLSIFPGTLATPYWTANNTPGGRDQAYTLSFGPEGVASSPKMEKHYVRLVQGRD
ncbi:MAG: DUF1566 domain-containing protein [Gammaproteobacteria bacterium]